MFWACSKVKSGRHFIEGILGSFLGTLFLPGPHFIEATAWVVSTWTTRCPSCTIWLNKMSNTFKIFQDHSSKTFFFVCCVFCLDIFGYHTLYFLIIEREHSDLAGIDRDYPGFVTPDRCALLIWPGPVVCPLLFFGYLNGYTCGARVCSCVLSALNP